MQTITYDELKQKCLKAEESYRFEKTPGKPCIYAIVKTPEDPETKIVHVFPGLKGEILLNGYNGTPAIALVKCIDARKFINAIEGKDKKLNNIISAIKKFTRLSS